MYKKGLYLMLRIEYRSFHYFLSFLMKIAIQSYFWKTVFKNTAWKMYKKELYLMLRIEYRIALYYAIVL